MRILLFITDRFPFGKGESFIENEIPYLQEYYDKVYVFPQGLTVNVSEQRSLPGSFVVLDPANTDDLYRHGRPSERERIQWSVKYMVPWVIKAFFSARLYREIMELVRINKLSITSLCAVVRTIAPLERNKRHFTKQMKDKPISNQDEVFIYSYWSNGFVCDVEHCIKEKINVKKVIARAHGVDLYNERHKCGYIPLRNEILQKVDYLYLISQDGLAYMRENYPSFNEKYRLSYLGTKDYASLDFNEVRGPFKIVSCSYVIPVKRVERIAEALAMISDAQIEWTHFGGGQDLESTEQLTKDLLGKRKNIKATFMGHIENARLMMEYQNRRFDLFINVSQSEGLPVSIMEALSFGLPIVATDVGSTRETVLNGKNGILLPEEFKNEELKAAIEYYMALDPKAYCQQRKASRKHWEDNFSAQNNYPGFFRSFAE